MTVTDVANDFAALCQAGKLDEAGHKYWADTIVSLEPGEAEMSRVEGIAAVRAKGEWWYGAHEVHSVTCTPARICGNMFTVDFSMDVTQKETGARFQMVETALYTVDDGKIIEERFFYAT